MKIQSFNNARLDPIFPTRSNPGDSAQLCVRQQRLMDSINNHPKGHQRISVRFHLCILLLIIIIPYSIIALAAMPGKTLPFIEEEDQDGARTIWFFFNVSGVEGTKHAYTPAKDIPNSNRWLKLQPNTPLQPADMAWWPNAVAMLQDKEKGLYVFKNQPVPLAELKKRFGKPVFRRFNTAEKPLALMVFRKNKKTPGKIPAILPKTKLYDAMFDLAINALGPRCTHDPDKVWVSIADTDEKRVYEIDRSGCITGEERKVDKEFFKLITKMEKDGTFD